MLTIWESPLQQQQLMPWGQRVRMLLFLQLLRDIVQVGVTADTYIGYFTADKNLSGNSSFTYDDAAELFTLAGLSPELRIQDNNNPGNTMTASLSFWDSTGVAAEIRMDGTGDLRIENADGEIRFDTGTSDVVVSGNGDLSVGNNLLVTGYLTGYGGTPADGSVLQWVTANSRAEFTLGVVMAIGTPVDNQIAVFSAPASIDGDATFTWDGADFTAGELFWDGSLNRLAVGDGTVATAGLTVNATATGSTFLQLSQAGTVRTTLRFDDTGDRTELSSSADNIAIRPGNVDTYSLKTATFQAGNYLFNIDETVGPAQDTFVLGYDDASGEIALRPSGGSGGDAVISQFLLIGA
jgi:hypothetical protein